MTNNFLNTTLNLALTHTASDDDLDGYSPVTVRVNRQYQAGFDELVDVLKFNCRSVAKRRQPPTHKLLNYESKKLRFYIGHLLFGRVLTDSRWSTIRKLAFEYAKFTETKKFSHTLKVDRSKLLSEVELKLTILCSCYFAEKHQRRFPNLRTINFMSVCEKIFLWNRNFSNRNDPSINIHYPVRNRTSNLYGEIEVNVPWFFETSRSTSTTTINYNWLQRSLAKTFYGYTPSPQWLGKLGFASPKKRLYSFGDYIKIRDAIVSSAIARKRPVNWVQLPNTPGYQEK